jgi:predicted ATPase
VIEQLERTAGFTREDTPDKRLDKVQTVLDAQVADLAPLFAAMLSLPLDRYPPLGLSPQRQKEMTLEALAGQVEALAQRQPVLMIYEDVHWIDATSQEALDLLVPRLRDLRVLLIVTYRPEYIPKWSEQAHITTLGLNRLGRRQGAELVRKLGRGKVFPQEILNQIVAHTDGVPLFVEELTKSVLESKLLRDEGDRYVLQGQLPSLAIPTTLRDSLIARLDRLAPIREVAQIGACIGREFSYELLAAVSPLKGQKLDEALEQLTGSGLLFRRGTPPDATYTFKHALVQDAAYESLLKAKRAELHGQIAQALEQDLPDSISRQPDLVAHHLTRAGLHEGAVPYWTAAGERSLSRMALSEAVGHLTNALIANDLTVPNRDRDRRELSARLILATAQLALFGWAAAQIIETLKPARELAIRLGASDELFRILDYYHTYYLQLCDFPTVLSINEEVASLAKSRGDSSAAMIALLDECITHHGMGNFQRARQATDSLFQTYDAKRDAHLVLKYNYDPKCIASAGAGYVLYALGFPDQARRAALDGLDAARRLGHPFNLCWSLTGGTHALLMRGETQLARQWVKEANDIASEHGFKYVSDVSVPIWGGNALVEEGNYAEGYARITAGLKVWREAGGVIFVPRDNAARAKALIALGRFEEAKDLLDETLALVERTGHRPDEVEIFRVRGDLERYYDDGAAESSYRKALEVARSQDAKGLELRAAVSLALLWQKAGKEREAYDMVAPIYNWFTEGFDTKDLKEAKTLLDQLS